MTETMTPRETAEWLRECDCFLLLTHRRPDGDTLGGAAALAQGLRAAGKTAFLLKNPETTPRYQRYVEDFTAPDGFMPEHTITVDTASAEMLQINAGSYAAEIALCVDHHPSNKDYARLACVDGGLASCGELIYEILIELNGSIDAIIAERLYVALTTDTGCFAFANTTANTLRVASLAVLAGAPQREINRRLFRTRTRSRVMLEGMINSGLEFHFGGAAAIAVITLDMMKMAGADEDDVDDIASIPGSIEGVLAGITIRELKNQRDCKVSVRSSPGVDSNGICEMFGGGGHPMAAGFSVELTVTEIKERLLDILGGFLPAEAGK